MRGGRRLRKPIFTVVTAAWPVGANAGHSLGGNPQQIRSLVKTEPKVPSVQNFPQFIVIHTVKGSGIVNKAEMDVFLELSCLFAEAGSGEGARGHTRAVENQYSFY